MHAWRRLLPLLAPLLAAAALGCGPTAELIPGEAAEEPAPTVPAPPTAPAVTATAQPLLPPVSLEWVAAGATAPDAAANGANGDGGNGAHAANGGGANGNGNGSRNGNGAGGADEAEDEEAAANAELARSVVQIVAADETRDPPAAVRDGSGVVIDAERGLILTSAHVVAPFGADGVRRYDAIRVGAAGPGGDPAPTHRAVIAALDPVSELAVLRATERIGGDGEAALGLPAAVVGNAAATGRGDELRIFGHPGLHPSGAPTSQAIAITEARVTGTRGHPAIIGGRTWLKMGEMRLPHGSAGGPAFNSAGELVGIAAQIAYDADAPVAHIRPLDLAGPLLAEARAADPAAPRLPPLARPGGAPGTGEPAAGDGVAVSEPLFARQALEEGDRRDLLEYARVFDPQPKELHYEFAAQGVPDGARVQEVWRLNGVLQDQFSAEYDWTDGPFRLVYGAIRSASTDMGLPSGVWTVEIWIGGAKRAAGRAFVGVPAPGRPEFHSLRFGSALSPIGIERDGPPEPGAPRLLAFFDYSDAVGVERLRWVFHRGGEEVYRSPDVPWRGGGSGVWWVGLPLDGGPGPGGWRVEVFADGELALSGGY